MVIVASNTPAGGPGKAKPLIEGTPTTVMKAAVWMFVVLPFVALLSSIPLAWILGWGPSVLDTVMAVVLYCVCCADIGTGFHRYFTHSAFKVSRPLRIALAMAGSLAVEGNIIQWVADHRRHHKFSDLEGDPHSPWRFGVSFWGLTRGLWHAHVGWLFKRELSNRALFAPDLLADKDMRLIDRLFPVMVVLSLGGPALIGGVATWSWLGALSAFFWAGLVRMAVLHHVTRSINSVCHVFGVRPFKTRKDDKATNFWPLAILSFGEAWHNLHHADPSLARHGVLRGQVDVNARIIWLFERFGWATAVHWPNAERLDRKRVAVSA